MTTKGKLGDTHTFQIRANLGRAYPDIYTPEALAALAALAPLDEPRRALMAARIQRRAARARDRQRLGFLDPATIIAGTDISVQDAREGKFAGSEIPADLQRQWIQGTGPATRPGAPRPSGACATSPTPCCRAPTAGCSTARTPWARCRRCRSTTSATSSWPSPAIRCS